MSRPVDTIGNYRASCRVNWPTAATLYNLQAFECEAEVLIWVPLGAGAGAGAKQGSSTQISLCDASQSTAQSN